MRLLDGKICPGMKVKMMATGAEFQVLECGYMLPLGLSPQQELCAGEVGYFTASIKKGIRHSCRRYRYRCGKSDAGGAARLSSGTSDGILRYLHRGRL